MKTIISLILFLQLNSFAQNDSTLKSLGFLSYVNLFSKIGEDGIDSLRVDDLLYDFKDINQLYRRITVYHQGTFDSVDLYSVKIRQFFTPPLIFMFAHCDSTYYPLESNLDEFISAFLIPYDNLTEEQAMKIISFYNQVEFKDYDITDLLTPDMVKSKELVFEDYNILLNEGSKKRVRKIYQLESHGHHQQTLEEIHIEYYFTKNRFSVKKHVMSKKIK